LDGLKGPVRLAARDVAYGEEVAARLECSYFGVDLPCWDYANYPSLKPDEVPESDGALVQASVLANALDRAQWCVGKNTSKYRLDCVCLGATDRGLYVAASDANAMVKVALGPGAIDLPDGQALISAASARKLRQILERVSSNASVRFEDGCMAVRAGSRTISVRLAEGRFPDPDALLPPNDAFCSVIAADAPMLSSFKKFAKLAGKGSGAVRMEMPEQASALSLTFERRGSGLKVQDFVLCARTGDGNFSAEVEPKRMAQALEANAKALKLLGPSGKGYATETEIGYRGRYDPLLLRSRTDKQESWILVSTSTYRN
jgi:DNA polymerase III sliding clamp (beta) subunit (PCNA family)